jgi:MFS family permease
MILMIIGGFGMLFFGDKGIGLAIAFSGISGFAAGTIPAANYEILLTIAPDNLRDKVCGWSDAICSLGLAIGMFTSGFLAADGVWTRAYSIYYLVIPVLILVVALYPKDVQTAATETKTDKENADNVARKGKSPLPASIIALLIIKVFSGLFYTSFGMFSSDYIINDAQLGSSVLVGSVQTITQVVNITASAVIFLWLKFFKGFSSMIAQVILGVFMMVFIVAGSSIPGIMLSAALIYVGLMSSHSSIGTIMGLAPDKQSIGRAAGLFMSMTFIGEALCGYIVPVLANLFLGSSSAINSLKISAIFSIIIGVISLPFFYQAYKLAFNKKPLEVQKLA